MVISVKHKFNSTKPDSTDSSLIRPSNWNDEHNLTLAGSRLLGRADSTAGAAQEIELGAGLEFFSGQLRTTGEVRFDVAQTNTPTEQAQARANIGAQLEPGAIMHFARNTPPPGWLKCNGATISRTAYAALFDAIGTTFGAGNGSTTFKLPDDRGEFLRGWDDGRGVDSGRAFGSTQGQAIQSHNHSASSGNGGNHSHNLSTASNDNTGSYSTQQLGLGRSSGTIYNNSNAIGNSGSHNHSVTVSNAGGPETRPRNRAYLVCIKY